MADTIRFFESCSKYVSSLDNSARLRYKEKLFCKEQLPDPYSLISGWLEDMNDWPDVTFGNIYTYLIESPGLFDRQAMQAYKSLEAYTYFISGHVKAVFMHTIAKDCPFCFLKADVVPSQRIRGEPHKPWVCVNRSNGSIRSAHCTCMAGLGEVCSHIAAVLFKIEAAVKFGLTTASCTSKACEWNRTYRDQINPEPIADVTYLTKGRRRLNVKSVRCNPDTPLPNDSVLQGLYKVVPTAVFFSAINNIDAEDTDTASESENESVLPKTLASMFNTEVNHLSDTEHLGNECQGDEKEGLLCIRKPWPGMCRTIYGEKQRFIDTYFKSNLGVYFSGDNAVRYEGGHYRITGRSDDVINVSGHRLGTAELEDVIGNHPAVAESAVVGYPHNIKGEGVYTFVVLKDQLPEDSSNIDGELRTMVKSKISSFSQPDIIQFVPSLPRTRSGKIMRRILRRIAYKQPDFGDISTLVDPAVVQNIIENRQY